MGELLRTSRIGDDELKARIRATIKCFLHRLRLSLQPAETTTIAALALPPMQAGFRQ